MPSSGADWSGVEAEINRIVTDSSEPFDANTILNVRDLFTFPPRPQSNSESL